VSARRLRARIASGLALAALFAGGLARAEEPKAEEPAAEDDLEGLEEAPMPPPGYVPGHRTTRVGLGLSPHVPGHQSVLPAAIAPSFGAPVNPAEGARLKFSGYLQAGGRTGFNTRRVDRPGFDKTIWHGDPLVPRGNVFENTNVVPYSWAELRFSYGTPTVTGNVSLGAWSFSESMQAAGYFQPNAQLWIRDAYLSYQPRNIGPATIKANVGVYEDRYGWMAEYSSGQYGAPLVATIPGVGETISVAVPIGSDLVIDLEQGIKTYMSRPPAEAPTGPTNNWLKPWEGQTLVNHFHLGAEYKPWGARPALHFIHASSRDDVGDDVALGNLRACYPLHELAEPAPDCEDYDHADGSLQVLAADIKFKFPRFGHLYLGVSHASAEHIRSLTNVVQILNAGGGRDLMDRYFGRNNPLGRGTLLLVGGEYNVSLGEVLRYPDEFFGEGPDLDLSIYGMYGHITADDPSRDGEDKYKFGIEATYTFLSWLAASGRFDRAVPYAHPPKVPNAEEQRLCTAQNTGPNGECLLYPGQNDNAYSVLTAKMVLRSDWTAREALTFQYSRFFYRSNFHLVTLNSGGQVSNQTDQPDRDLIAVYGTLWW